MKKYFFIISVCLLFIACVAPQNPTPEMPKLKTEKGKACLKTCQLSYNDCTESCSLMEVRGQSTQKHRVQCFNNCGSVLGDCYSLCED